MVNDSISMLNVVPSFLINLLSDSLKITYEAPYATLPSLSTGWRHPKQPKILSPFFSLLFKAFDACFPNRTSASLWPQIPPAVMCLSLPVSEVLFINTDYSGTPFKFSKHLLSLKVSDFFWFDHSDQLLHYRLPGDCPFPGLLRKIKKAITDIKLLAHRYFAFHMGLIQYSTFTVDEVYLTRTHINSSSIAIQPFLTSILVIADKFLPSCSNHSIRHQILRHTAADQSLALHLVYLQRLLRPLSSHDFVSSWLVYAFQVYTGHKSVLPWFCFPDKYKSRASSVPVLKHLCKLLLKLPKLVPSSGWSARWFLDFPLCSVLSTVPSVRPPCDPSKLDPRFLVSDISFWQPDLGIVDGVTSHFAWPSRTLRAVFLAVHRDRGPVSLVFPPVMDSKIVLSHADYFTMPPSDGASSWMPDCSHWTISNSSRSSVAVARLPLGALRRYWHPSKDVITARMGPPLRLPANLLLPPASWRLFWSLEMPAKAFTPWWRLLYNRVAHRAWCHRIVPDKVPSPVCALCGLFEEDLYHFVVGCHVKSFFWQDVVSLLSLQELLPSDASIWLALTTFCSGDLSVIDEDVLVALGAAYSTLWKYHWRCVIDEEPWIASVALNMVRQDHGLLFSSLSLASVQAGTLTLPLIHL